MTMAPAAGGRAALYLGVSTTRQARSGGETEGYSIPAQRAACRRKAANLSAEVVDGDRSPTRQSQPDQGIGPSLGLAPAHRPGPPVRRTHRGAVPRPEIEMVMKCHVRALIGRAAR